MSFRIRDGDPIRLVDDDVVVHVAARVARDRDMFSTLTLCTQNAPHLRVSHYKAKMAFAVPTCLWCIAERVR